MANYLYNGIELPELPQWDKTVYPYAAIYDGSGTGIGAWWHLIVSNNPLFKNSEFCYYKVNTQYLQSGCNEYQSELRWTYTGSADNVFSSEMTHSAESDVIVPFWSNYDILNEDGSVYLPASDPVPVGVLTLTASDLYKKVNGQLVKHTLYKKVGGKLVALDEYVMLMKQDEPAEQP